MNFNGVLWDPMVGWLGTEGKEDLPPHIRVGNLWWPVWDPETHKLIPLPEGVSRVMVAMNTYPGQKVEIYYWNQEKKTFTIDEEGTILVPEQMVESFTSWALEPEAPQVW